MDYSELYKIVAASTALTLVADAFRASLGIEGPAKAGRASSRHDRYSGLGECFLNRRRVRL